MSVHHGKKRMIWIDVLRGFAMLLVIWGHISNTEHMFFLITGPFKIPLFFAITGYLFNNREGNTRVFFKQLFFRLLVPWFVLSLIWAKIPYALLKNGFNAAGDVLYRFASGTGLWFMPCCIVAECLLFFTEKFIPSDRLRMVTMVATCVFGLVLSHFGLARFALIDVAFTAQGFALFGCLYRKYEAVLQKHIRWPIIAALGAVYVGLTVLSAVLYPGKAIDVHRAVYYNYAICFILIAVSLFILFVCARKIHFKKNWVAFVGRNTLTFYICHYYARKVLAKGLKMAHVNLPSGIGGYLIEMVFVCAAMSALSLILNRWFPWVVGRNPARKRK